MSFSASKGLLGFFDVFLSAKISDVPLRTYSWCTSFPVCEIDIWRIDININNNQA
jgi:hypothetical protein